MELFVPQDVQVYPWILWGIGRWREVVSIFCSYRSFFFLDIRLVVNPRVISKTALACLLFTSEENTAEVMCPGPRGNVRIISGPRTGVTVGGALNRAALWESARLHPE